MKNKAVFLDRDGTINVDHGYVYKYEDFEFIDGVIDSLKKLQDAGFLLVIITNQSGIARGYFSENDFHILHEKIDKKLEGYGIKISGLYYCPHLNDCSCRKPQTKLFYDAANDLNIDFSKSYAIGDRMRDLMICKEEPVTGFLISEEPETDQNIIVCDSMEQAVNLILKNNE